MKYKTGDKVRVRQWKAMEKEFGLACIGCIKLPTSIFRYCMKKFCGEIVTIDKKHKNYYKIKEDGGKYRWTDEMLEGYGFEYGDKIEVSADKKKWRKRIYVGYIDREKQPYRCVPKEEEDNFYKGGKVYTFGWEYARPLKNKRGN